MARRSQPLRKRSFIYGTVREERLRALLDADGEAGRVVTSRSGMIHRSHYAKALGWPPTNMTQFQSVFAEYEGRLGIQSGTIRRLTEMREWLADSFERGELQIRDRTIDRSAFLAHFELRAEFVSNRYPHIRNLFLEIDARAAREDYIPKDKHQEIERVRSILAANPQLLKDRLTINRRSLSKIAQVSHNKLRHDERFVNLIKECEELILFSAKKSRIDPYLHGRVFEFSSLLSLWPKPFLEKIGVRFALVASGWASAGARSRYASLYEALEWIGRSTDPNCRAVVSEAHDKARVLLDVEWEDAIFSYRAYLCEAMENGKSPDISVDANIRSLNIMIEALASGGIAPALTVSLPGIKNAKRRAGHVRSVAEVESAGLAERRQEYFAFMQDIIIREAKSIGVHVGLSEADDALVGIAADACMRNPKSTDLAESVRQVVEHRLEALKKRAVALVSEAMQKYKYGQSLLLRANIDCAQFEADFTGSHLSTHERKILVRSLFPDPRTASSDAAENGLANLLALIVHQRSGVPPKMSQPWADTYGYFFIQRYVAYGGIDAIAPMLIPDINAIGAVLTLYMIESGANLAVGRTLDRLCIEKSDLPGHRRITGHKARARGKPIIVDLPDDSPAVKAIEWLQSASRYLVSQGGADADRLFLTRAGGSAKLLTWHRYAYWFKAFVASTPNLEGLAILPSMIRPSVLLYAALSNEGRLAVGVALGQHGPRVSQGYQQKWPTRILYDNNIRGFQYDFETLVISGLEDVASKMGITVDQLDERLKKFCPTGLGTFCRNPKGRPGELRETCSTLDCWDKCPRLLIIAEVEAIAALRLWQQSLRVAQGEWVRDRPERWEEVWLPWLSLTDVVEEKMTRGPMIKIWNAAGLRAQEIASHSNYVPPRPW